MARFLSAYYNKKYSLFSAAQGFQSRKNKGFDIKDSLILAVCIHLRSQHPPYPFSSSQSIIAFLTAVPEKDENVGIFFRCRFHSYQIRNWPVLRPTPPPFIPLRPIVMQTRSNSACTSPDDNNDDIYASDHAVSPVEAGASDSDMLIDKPLSGR